MPGRETLAATVLSLGVVLGAAAFTLNPPTDPPPDFASMAPAAKKQAFFSYLRPKVKQANQQIIEHRQWLLALAADGAADDPSWWQRRRLRQLAEAYDLPWEDAPAREMIDKLLLRVDIVPAPLALVQAAKESGWGTSRFAVNANNWFGQQCFDEGCGSVPRERDEGRPHEVAGFASVQAAVDAYMHNLNTHHRYETFRTLRQASRERDAPLKGTELAQGLLAYSERREAYIQEVIQMIRYNDLE